MEHAVKKTRPGRRAGVPRAARAVIPGASDASLRYTRSLIEASLDPFVTINPEGKITDVNEATVKVTGVPRPKLIGTDFSDYFTEPEKARQGYSRAFELGSVTDYPLTIRHANGNLVDVLYNASVYRDAKGNVLGVFAAARDVTESKRILSEYAETRNFLDNILESSTKYSIISMDLDRRILSWNEGARRNYGYRAEEIIGKDAKILHVPEDIRSGSVDRLIAEAHEKSLAQGEFDRLRKDGTRFAGSLVVTRRNDSSGRAVGYLIISNDISGKKRALEQLQGAANYARSLIEASLDPLVTISPEGKITDVNEATVKATGVSRDELIGTDFSDYFTEPEKARLGYEQVFAKGYVTDYPLTIRHGDGRLTFVLYNASVYKDVHGRVLGAFAAARDITAQRQAANYARSLIEASLDPLVTISPEGKITDVNEATVRATGFSRDELIGTDFSDYFTEPDEARRGYEQVFAKGYVTDYPLTILHRDGRRTFVLYNASVYLDPQGQVLGVFAAARDVTAQRKAEEKVAEQRAREERQTRQVQKMEALGTLAGGIAHDFNNILAAIVINTELALDDVRDPGAPQRYLPIVLHAAERGKELVKQVLAFSRKRDREQKPVRLAPVIREALSFLRASLPATIEIEERIRDDKGVTLSDATEIHQILMNLGTNAAYAMRDSGGRLTVRLDPVDLDDEATLRLPGLQPGPYVRLTVEDTGTGIPAHLLPRIFDPFFTTKRQGEGTGMGLPVVHGIVTRCGGAISVASEVGKGSVFQVYFPRVAADAANDEALADPIPTGRERVLVIDDESIQAESLHDMLQRLGYHVTVETESVKALKLLRAHPGAFDVVITDQAMPHLVGSKLAEEAMKIRPDLPIILCTGFSDQVCEGMAVIPGIRELVMKPYTIREMASAIRRAIDGRVR